MSLQTPTIADVNANIIAQLEASIGQTIPFLPKLFERVLAKALAAVFVILYKYVGFIFLQLFVAYASFDATEINGQSIRPLVEWGRLVGVGDPKPATRAELEIEITVLEQTGSIRAGQQLLRESTGVIYSVVSAVALDDSTVTAVVQAVDDSEGNLGTGTLGNLEIGDELSFANPVPYVVRTVTVSDVVVTAADAEKEAAYRARVVRRFQAKPQGGSYADYQDWAEGVEGVLNAYPYASDVPGEVDLYVEVDPIAVTNPDGIPTDAQLEAVGVGCNYDEEGVPNRRPINDGLNLLPIARIGFDFTISGLDADDTATLQTQISKAVDEHLRTLEPYIDGLSVLPRRDRVHVSDVGGVVSDVVRAAGGTFGALTMSLSGSSLLAYTFDDGEKAKLGTISYV